MSPTLLEAGAGPLLVLAHGAGAPMDSAWMNEVSALLVERGLTVVRFEFPYMAARRTGQRRPPDRMPVLEQTWRDVVAALAERGPLVLGGKSMGGRVASHVADAVGARGLVCLSYPFHPPGKPERPRTAHLAALRTPTLIVEGTQDPFGSPEEIAGYTLSPAIELAFIEGGDHDLVAKKRSGRTRADCLTEVATRAADFIHGLAAPVAR